MISNSTRRAWLATLASAPRDRLAALFEQHVGGQSQSHFDWLRHPETGLTMVRARIGGRGDRFNLGETTLTRCVVRHRDAGGEAVAGVGYVKGRDPDRARWVAMLDALLQQPTHHAQLMEAVVLPLRQAVLARRATQAAATATSRVSFFTLEPGAS